jgi:flagellar biosynthetic protein FlhB
MGKLALGVALKIGVVILFIAILDYAYQKYEFEKSIKMSKQEVKDEYKDTEGNPQLKARVRQIQREMSRRRMAEAVPTADVVITNPTHLAVALKYDPEEMAAPYVIAKGERLIAQRIKEIALQNNIPVIEDKPLARALFKLCDIGQAVPANMYRAVAEVLAYVYRLRGKVVK